MTSVHPPDERSCERCGREEVWSDEQGTWVAAGSDLGSPHCVHDWDITGTYNPVHP